MAPMLVPPMALTPLRAWPQPNISPVGASPSSAAALFDHVPTHITASAEYPDDDRGTAATVAAMCDIIRRSAEHPLVSAAAGDILRPLPPDATELDILRAVHAWIREHVRFQNDGDRQTALGFPEALDLLIEPPVLLSQEHPTGDCDDFTMLAGAVLSHLRIPFEIVTIAGLPDQPDKFSHVYLQAQPGLAQRDRVVMDCSHGPYLGWEAPRYWRRQVWDLNGRPIDSAQPLRFSRMHGLAEIDPESGAPMNQDDAGGVSKGEIIQDVFDKSFNLLDHVLNRPRQGEFIETASGRRSYGVPGAQPSTYPIQYPPGNSAILATGGISSSAMLLGLAGIALLVVLSSKK